MQLSKNFTFEELTNSSSYPKLVAKNREEAGKYIDSLTKLAVDLLQPIRDAIGPLNINSAFRGETLNLAVGSKSKSSQHMFGEAADISSSKYTAKQIFDMIMEDKIPNLDKTKIAQIILEKNRGAKEFTWVHISLWTDRYAKAKSGATKTQALVFDGTTYHNATQFFA